MTKLTASRVAALRTPGRYTDAFGLALRVAPGGSKQWVWRGTIDGRRREVGLGAAALTTLAEAREIAFEYTRMARRGVDPTALAADRRVPTFAEATELVIASLRGGWKDSGRSETNWRSSLERFAFPAIGAMPVSKITTADLKRVLEPIWHDKRETARKVKTRLGVVMRWCVTEGHRSDDPTAALTLPRNGHHTEHFASLPADRLGPALARLDASKRVWRPTVACLTYIVATACRSGEARLARWDEITGDVWTIPGERTKTGKAHVVPLSSMALEALAEARQYADKSGLVFVAPRGGPLSTSTLSKFTRAERFTPHGVRASFRSWAAETGIAREVAEMCLGHVAGAVERAYQRSDLLAARRDALDRWGSVL